MKMTAGGYDFVGLTSLSYTNEPLSKRRKRSERIRKVQKRTMVIADVAYAFSLWFAAVHLDYLKACDEWVAHKIMLCLSSLWQLAVKVTKQNYVGPKGWPWWIPDTIELGIFCIRSDKEKLSGLTGMTCTLWQMKRYRCNCWHSTEEMQDQFLAMLTS